ncbi:hypothetical protein [Streptomyces sp. WAC07149]|uniref:hypothetical protein n=1 Tax=Streptomyces sp. WAC07149 TaxID=2487425 RepID=UPI00163D1936|nr:hypothetical protein [Streptomyces sp. WAC07149]
MNTIRRTAGLLFVALGLTLGSAAWAGNGSASVNSTVAAPPVAMADDATWG